MQTVVETPIFIQRARKGGVTDQERKQMITMLAHKPDSGDVIAGTGGARKLRVATGGKGKRGG